LMPTPSVPLTSVSRHIASSHSSVLPCLFYIHVVIFLSRRIILATFLFDYIGKNAISLGEVDNLVELIQARRLGLGNFFLLTLDALDRSINESLDGLERASIKRGLTNFFFLEPR
jgi:hypothetical protein